MSDGPRPTDLVMDTLEDQNWYPVAHKEMQDAIRSKGLWVLSAVFTLIFIAPVAGVLYFGGPQDQVAQQLGMQAVIVNFYLTITTWFVPIVAIFVGFAAISKERSSGSLKVLLSQPVSRADVVIGKVIGRCAVAGVTLLIAYALTALFLILSSLEFKAGMFAQWAFFTFAFTVAVVAIAVSISGMTKKSMYSLAGNVLFYMEMTWLWNAQIGELAGWVSDNLNLPVGPSWQLGYILKLINPAEAYRTLVVSTINTGENAALNARWSMFNPDPETAVQVCNKALNGNATVRQTFFGRNTTVCASEGAGLPLWLSDPAVFVYLIAWIGIAAAISYYTFNRGDL